MVDGIERANPSLLHGPVAAVWAEKELGITDRSILDAIRYHTTGRAGMSRLEMVVYLADLIEPGRRYPGVDRLASWLGRIWSRPVGPAWIRPSASAWTGAS